MVFNAPFATCVFFLYNHSLLYCSGHRIGGWLYLPCLYFFFFICIKENKDLTRIGINSWLHNIMTNRCAAKTIHPIHKILCKTVKYERVYL